MVDEEPDAPAEVRHSSWFSDVKPHLPLIIVISWALLTWFGFFRVSIIFEANIYGLLFWGFPIIAILLMEAVVAVLQLCNNSKRAYIPKQYWGTTRGSEKGKVIATFEPGSAGFITVRSVLREVGGISQAELGGSRNYAFEPEDVLDDEGPVEIHRGNDYCEYAIDELPDIIKDVFVRDIVINGTKTRIYKLKRYHPEYSRIVVSFSGSHWKTGVPIGSPADHPLIKQLQLANNKYRELLSQVKEAHKQDIQIGYIEKPMGQSENIQQ